jgi:hypothetical protein
MKRLTNGKILGTLLFFTILFSLLINITHMRATAATIIIAASNSTNTWKSEATATCTGSNDQNTINKYLTIGNTVELAPGTFNINGLIIPATGGTLYGQGNTSVLNYQNKVGGILIDGVCNITIGSLEITGHEDPSYGFIVGLNGLSSVSNFYFHDIKDMALGGDDFAIYACGGMIQNISFVRCDANSPDGFGFVVNGAGSPSTVTNLAYLSCTVENAGVASTRGNPWVTGFDLAGYDGMTVNGEYVINCSVNGAWESDFHYEAAPTKENCVIVGSSATNAGLKPSGFNNGNGTFGPQYGAGYLIDGLSDIILYNNTASSNVIADIRAWNGSAYVNITPVANEIYPSTSLKTDSGVSQGNCGGVIINTDSTHEELILYSTDGNPVNQQIALGGYYASGDGNTYVFNGTSVVAQFTNYAVMRLVASNPAALAIATSSLPNGTVGAAYSQTLTATGGTAPYAWAIASGSSIPAGLSFSSTGVISGTPTTAGGPTIVIFQVTDSTSTAVTASLSITINNTPPSISTTSLPNGTVGMAYSQMLAATGGTAPYAWSIVSGKLPGGLSLSSGGVISGTPTKVGGPTSVTFLVADSTGMTATASLSIIINNMPPSITTNSLPNGTLGTAYSQILSATGGTPPYTWSIALGSLPLPAGLSFSSRGVISGTPSAASGPTSVTFQVTDSTGMIATKSLPIAINNTPPKITTNSLPNGTVGTAYSQTLTASGGTAPYTWAIESGNLPAGLSLSLGGVISGTPTTAIGPTSMTFQATDSTGKTATKSLAITVNNRSTH